MTCSIAQPKVLFDFLNNLEKRPSRSLSQNFLIDQNIIHKLIDLASLSLEHVILEIGPGAGAITEALLKKGHRVIAIEKDKKLVSGLQARFLDENLTLIQGDILDIDLEAILPKDTKVQVISNLPFQITSLILAKLLPMNERICDLSLIMQKEVVDRILASPYTKAYSSLSIFTHLYANVSSLFDISSNCFFPRPKVNSSAIKLTLKKPPIEDDIAFIELMRKGFNQRRKMLSSSLPYPSQKIQEALTSLDLSPKARAEELSFQNWIELFQTI